MTLLITRLQGLDRCKSDWLLRVLPCREAFEPAEAANVTAALRSGELWKARSLISNDEPDDNAVLIGKEWWLSK